ncbi:hypothetical protein BC826DRAFT_1113780 [Russula brevipes]|nr:hypothetical protein BC826DRAFT_1113780 [Russula brevipes]
MPRGPVQKHKGNSNRFYIVLAAWTPMRPPGQLRMLALWIVPSLGEDDLCTCGTGIFVFLRAAPQLDTPLVSRAPTPAPEKDEDDPKLSVPPHRSDPSTARAACPPTSGGGGGGNGDDFGAWAMNAPPPLGPSEKTTTTPWCLFPHTNPTPRPRAPPVHLRVMNHHDTKLHHREITAASGIELKS